MLNKKKVMETGYLTTRAKQFCAWVHKYVASQITPDVLKNTFPFEDVRFLMSTVNCKLIVLCASLTGCVSWHVVPMLTSVQLPCGLAVDNHANLAF